MLVIFQKIYLKISCFRSVLNVKILRLFGNCVIGMLPGSRSMILNILESVPQFSYLNCNTWSNVKYKLFKLRPIVSGISYPFPRKTFSMFMRKYVRQRLVTIWSSISDPPKDSHKCGFKLLFFTGITGLAYNFNIYLLKKEKKKEVVY